MSLKESPLQPCHVEAGAKFAEFGGWSMPLEYAGGGVIAEHTAVRESAGIFDVSHLGKARVRGDGAVDFLNRCLTNDLDKIGNGQAQYTMLCNPDGGVVDDLIAYRFADDEVFLIPNAANTAAVVAALQAELERGGDALTLTNEHLDHAVIAVQGPQSDEILNELGLPTGHDYMAFDVAELELNGSGAEGQATAAELSDSDPSRRGIEGDLAPSEKHVKLTVCRTGYTGERGYELVCASDDAVAVWNAVMAAGGDRIRPAGLGARDTLRTEMGYPLHGQDLSPEITPVQARCGWAVGWKKESFFGDQALRAEKDAKPARVLRGIRAIGRGIPRHDMGVVDAPDGGSAVGTVTSGTFSPTLKQGVGLALLAAGTVEGDRVWVQVRNRTEEFEVVKPPFVTPGVRES